LRVPFIDHFFSVGWIRKTIWKAWYPFLTRRLHGEEILFLNYAYEEEPPMNIPLSPADEPNRACIQLYHHVATPVDLRGKTVLEVSCGHGGGASYLARTLQPKSYTALDLNPAGIRFCKQRHRVDGLNFVQGDAENLPFEPDTFDAVINVEASHCYPNFPRFLSEVERVLRPGGHFSLCRFPVRRRSNRMGKGNRRCVAQNTAYAKHQHRSPAWNESEFHPLPRFGRAAFAKISTFARPRFCRRQRLANSHRPEQRRAFVSFVLL